MEGKEGEETSVKMQYVRKKYIFKKFKKLKKNKKKTIEPKIFIMVPSPMVSQDRNKRDSYLLLSVLIGCDKI